MHPCSCVLNMHTYLHMYVHNNTKTSTQPPPPPHSTTYVSAYIQQVLSLDIGIIRQHLPLAHPPTSPHSIGLTLKVLPFNAACAGGYTILYYTILYYTILYSTFSFSGDCVCYSKEADCVGTAAVHQAV